MKNYASLPKRYYFDTKTKNLVLAYFANEDTETDLADIPAGFYAWQNFDGIVQIAKAKDFEKRFKKVGDIFGIFHCRDVEETTLNLKTLKDTLLSITRPEENIVEIKTKNGTLKLVYKDSQICAKDLRNLKQILSLANRTL